MALSNSKFYLCTQPTVSLLSTVLNQIVLRGSGLENHITVSMHLCLSNILHNLFTEAHMPRMDSTSYKFNCSCCFVRKDFDQPRGPFAVFCSRCLLMEVAWATTRDHEVKLTKTKNKEHLTLSLNSFYLYHYICMCNVYFILRVHCHVLAHDTKPYLDKLNIWWCSR